MKINIVKNRLKRLRRRRARRENRASRHYRMQMYFILIALSVILGAMAVASVLAYFMGRRVQTDAITLPIIALVALFVILVSLADTVFLTRKVFKPIERLSRAMNRVAEGDFAVSLQTKTKIVELRDSYRSFNRMVGELGATETLQSDFVSNVSHEIKTPISAIEGYAALLQDSTLSPEEYAQYTEKILFNTRRLSELVGNILLLSKAENKVIPPSAATYRLDEQVREALLALESKWTEKDIEFDIELDEVTYTGNEALLYHVFANLIDNAVKFAPRGGLVSLRLTAEQGGVCFSVEDNGPGISDEEKGRIFRKFYQTDGSHAKAGNGLGLALVKQILELSGGTVTVEDATPCGARFVVFLKA